MVPRSRFCQLDDVRYVQNLFGIAFAGSIDHGELSPRHFARLFRNEVGITPASWVETTRVTVARRLLEGGQHSPKQVAARCGFADADTLRRAFARRVGVTPAEYRKRYARV